MKNEMARTFAPSKYTRVSHVLKAIGLPDEVAKGTIRILLDKENIEFLKSVKKSMAEFLKSV